MKGPPLREFGRTELDTAVTDLKPRTPTLLGQAVSSALIFLTSFTAQSHCIMTIAPVTAEEPGAGREAWLLARAHTACDIQGLGPGLSQGGAGTCPRSHPSEG